MFELLEVKIVVKVFKGNVLNLIIINVIVKFDKLIKNVIFNEFKNYLLNEIIFDVYNVGKNIIYKFLNNKNLVSYLWMMGKYFIDSSINKIRKYDYIIFELDK